MSQSASDNPRSEGAAQNVDVALTATEVYRAAAPSVVLVLASDDLKSGVGGTGFVISASGLVITAAHVVLNDSGEPYETLYVFLRPSVFAGDNAKDLKRRHAAKATFWSPPEELNLAVLEIEQPPADLSALHFANSDCVDIGDPVVLIGHPESGGLWSLSSGMISSTIAGFNRVPGKDVWQTTAALGRGGVGGPLLNLYEDVVGISIADNSGSTGGVGVASFGFALKGSVVAQLLGQHSIPVVTVGNPHGKPDGEMSECRR